MAPNFGRIFRNTTIGREGEWFYCLRHRKVEEGPDCPAKDRLGPYASREDAEHAMDLARERDENWRTDPRWNDPDEGRGPGHHGDRDHGDRDHDGGDGPPPGHDGGPADFGGGFGGGHDGDG